jgi:hypothetical protein
MGVTTSQSCAVADFRISDVKSSDYTSRELAVFRSWPSACYLIVSGLESLIADRRASCYILAHQNRSLRA